MQIPNINKYQEEKNKWEQSNKPTRSKEKIQELFNICCDCENYEKFTNNSGQCQICTCFIKKAGTRFNKLAWATTRCPLEEPKWIEEPPYRKSTQIEKAAEVVIQPPAPIKQSPNDCGCG